ncbi:MAG: hypothetical protein IKK34_13005 [Clostridia bacterium]|nr:hypothetical protein [Clostridia bacterium]
MRSAKLTVRETAIFGLLGALMYASKILMEMLPNAHLIGAFIIALTVVYRKKALYPLYTFILLTGMFAGFANWWLPYLYIWAVLWAAAMLLPKRLPPRIAPLAYMLLCGLHGLGYGVLYAPAQVLLFGLNYQGMIAWIAAGLPFDVMHGISNFFCGALVVPLIHAIRLAERVSARQGA